MKKFLVYLFFFNGITALSLCDGISLPPLNRLRPMQVSRQGTVMMNGIWIDQNDEMMLGMLVPNIMLTNERNGIDPRQLGVSIIRAALIKKQEEQRRLAATRVNTSNRQETHPSCGAFKRFFFFFKSFFVGNRATTRSR